MIHEKLKLCRASAMRRHDNPDLSASAGYTNTNDLGML
jgi:hypothetical protein